MMILSANSTRFNVFLGFWVTAFSGDSGGWVLVIVFIGWLVDMGITTAYQTAEDSHLSGEKLLSALLHSPPNCHIWSCVFSPTKF